MTETRLETTIIISEDVAQALDTLYSEIEDMGWDYEIFIEACLAITRHDNYFEFGVKNINIRYEK